MAEVYLSPEMPRRTTRVRQLLSQENEDNTNALSSSLPPLLSPKEAEYLAQMRNSEPQGLQAIARPRSASVHSTSSAGMKLRRSLRLSRTRPSSAKQSRSRVQDAHETTDGGDAHQIEVAFARIRDQLTLFTEEDQAITERLNRLNSGLLELRSACSRGQLRSHVQQTPVAPTHVADGWTPPQVPTLMISNSRSDLFVPLEVGKTNQKESDHGEGTKSSQPRVIVVEETELSPRSTNSSGAEDDVFFTSQ